MVFLLCKLVLVEGRSGGDNSGKRPLYQFPGLWRFHLVADGDLHACFQHLTDIAIRRMKRYASHGIVVPLGQGDTQ